MVSRKAGRTIEEIFMHEVHTKIFSFSLLIFNFNTMTDEMNPTAAPTDAPATDAPATDAPMEEPTPEVPPVDAPPAA